MHLPQDALGRGAPTRSACPCGLPVTETKRPRAVGCGTLKGGPPKGAVRLSLWRGMPRVMPCAGRASEGKEFYVCVTGERHRAGL